mmetsp:Transcript_24260/g.68825  ORF Transcript_24260/g.68825 Transcript_24260/m.68825 type:complete len:265 (-) Transcript_24260:33-827(-)
MQLQCRHGRFHQSCLHVQPVVLQHVVGGQLVHRHVHRMICRPVYHPVDQAVLDDNVEPAKTPIDGTSSQQTASNLEGPERVPSDCSPTRQQIPEHVLHLQAIRELQGQRDPNTNRCEGHKSIVVALLGQDQLPQGQVGEVLQPRDEPMGVDRLQSRELLECSNTNHLDTSCDAVPHLLHGIEQRHDVRPVLEHGFHHILPASQQVFLVFNLARVLQSMAGHLEPEVRARLFLRSRRRLHCSRNRRGCSRCRRGGRRGSHHCEAS